MVLAASWALGSLSLARKVAATISSLGPHMGRKCDLLSHESADVAVQSAALLYRSLYEAMLRQALGSVLFREP